MSELVTDLQSKKEYGFAFAFNVGHLDGESELEILPGFRFVKATADQVRTIKEKIGKFWSLSELDSLLTTAIWECASPFPSGSQLKVLPAEEWRYYTIDFEGDVDTLHYLEQAFCLSDKEPVLGFVDYFDPSVNGFGTRSSPSTLFHMLEQARSITEWKYLSLTRSDIKQYAQIYKRLHDFSDSAIDIQQIVNDLSAMNRISHTSPLRFLGYFAILESIITHKPDPKDSFDSITRQVKKKLTLLNKRFEEPIDYSIFGLGDNEKIWGKMYSLRSAIAHGDKPKFDSDLRSLKSLSTASQLLQQTTKAVIRHILVEPQLVIDLREC